MVPRMSEVRRPSLGLPASFKQPPKNETAPSSVPYRICSSRNVTKLLPKPTRHRAKQSEAANQLRFTFRRSSYRISLYGPPQRYPRHVGFENAAARTDARLRDRKSDSDQQQ